MTVSHISDVDAHSILDAVDIEETAAVLRNEAVDQRNFRAALNQTPCQVRTDEAEASGDQHVLILKESGVVHLFDRLQSIRRAQIVGMIQSRLQQPSPWVIVQFRQIHFAARSI